MNKKTPDEIKKGLECCITDNCNECPYRPLYDVWGCKLARAQDALALIQQLEAENTRKHEKIIQLYNSLESVQKIIQAIVEDSKKKFQKLEAERDAAIEDMKQTAIYLCCACKNYHHAVRGVSHHWCEVFGKRDDFTGAMSCGMFKWRGVQKEE